MCVYCIFIYECKLFVSSIQLVFSFFSYYSSSSFLSFDQIILFFLSLFNIDTIQSPHSQLTNGEHDHTLHICIVHMTMNTFCIHTTNFYGNHMKSKKKSSLIALNSNQERNVWISTFHLKNLLQYENFLDHCTPSYS